MKFATISTRREGLGMEWRTYVASRRNSNRQRNQLFRHALGILWPLPYAIVIAVSALLIYSWLSRPVQIEQQIFHEITQGECSFLQTCNCRMDGPVCPRDHDLLIYP